MSHTISKATLDDAAIIQSIIQETISSIFHAYYPAGAVEAFLEYHNKTNIEKAINRGIVLLLKMEGIVVGTGALYKNKIHRLYVLPGYQGQGLGKLLLQELELLAAKSGFTSVIVEATLPAVNMYLKKGYKPLEWVNWEINSSTIFCYYEMSKTISPQGSYPINYNGRRFVTVANSENGEVSGQTVFEYHQEGNIIWADYKGGEIIQGFLLGHCEEDGSLNFTYQHINRNNETRTGRCKSIPEILSDGRIRLNEHWQWTTGDCSEGSSVIEEVPANEISRK